MRGALFVGVATLDVIQQVLRAPGPNEKVSSTARLVCAGGPATNAAVTCAALGVPATLLSAVGRSVLGAAIRADLTGCGVRFVDAAAEPQALPPVSAIAVGAGGERSVVSPNDILAVRPVGGPDDPSGLLAEVVGVAPSVVLTDGWYADLAVPVLDAFQGRAVRVLDGGSLKASTAVLLDRVEVAVVSADFRPPGRESDAEVLDWLADAGVRYAAMTRGEAPVLYRWGSARGEVGIPVVDVVDTLGAGDIFHGAFVAALVRLGVAPGELDRVEPVGPLRAAAGVAARSVRTFGTREWRRTLSEREATSRTAPA